MASESFKPAHMIAAGKFKERGEGDGVIFWDDRDPDYAGKKGAIGGYIFRKVRPCKPKLGHLKVERDGDTFYLVDNGELVSVAMVGYFHERHADVYIETFEPFRCKGYATKLLGWVSDWLTDNGYLHESGCAVDNHASFRLHVKLGFKVDGHICWSKASRV